MYITVKECYNSFEGVAFALTHFYRGFIMPLSEKALENKKRYTMEYAKTHLKRIPLDVQNEKYEEIKQASEKTGETINGYIKKAIDERLASGK